MPHGRSLATGRVGSLSALFVRGHGVSTTGPGMFMLPFFRGGGGRGRTREADGVHPLVLERMSWCPPVLARLGLRRCRRLIYDRKCGCLHGLR